jgi:putative hydrolase of the HAD superfamily
MVKHFELDEEEVDRRHHLTFDSYERGHLTLEKYLEWTVFYELRPFTVEDVKQWMFAEAKPLPGTYDLYQAVKRKHNLRLGIISNEGSGLVQDRVKRFRLDELADVMIFSHAVGLRKPDPEIWHLGLKLTQTCAPECIYIDDRSMFVDFAASLGFRAYQHVSAEDTAQFLAGLGFTLR